MIRGAVIAALFATTAQAETFCADLTSLTDQVIAEIALPDGTPGTCATTLDLSGTRPITCRWPFAYRAARATKSFHELLDATTQCLDAVGITDQGVNHPDSYDLRTFNTETTQVSVSIKDKGALQKTYIFLRVAPAP